MMLYGGFLKWGFPNSWMVYIENMMFKWMITSATPTSNIFITIMLCSNIVRYLVLPPMT